MEQQEEPEHKKRCQAMIDAGVYDPESHEGINFCVNFCPYECCIVFENPETLRQLRARNKATLVKELYTKGISVVDIALILGTSYRTVQRFLKK